MEQPFRLLLVEDGRADAMITRALISEAARLSGQTFLVDHAVDFGHALRFLESQGDEPFDAVVLDLGLPDASGVELVVELEKRFPGIAIIVNTGAEGEFVAEESLASGAQEFLRKGHVTPHTMALTLRNAVVRARLRRELAESEAEHRALFDFSPCPIWVLEAHTLRILRANQSACDLHGWPLPALLGMNFPALMPDESVEDLRQAFQVAPAAVSHRLWRHRARSGQPLLLQLTAHAISVRSGNAIIVTAQDVTAWRMGLQNAAQAAGKS
jgi:PAS domain S-box-containing protein